MGNNGSNLRFLRIVQGKLLKTAGKPLPVAHMFIVTDTRECGSGRGEKQWRIRFRQKGDNEEPGTLISPICYRKYLRKCVDMFIVTSPQDGGQKNKRGFCLDERGGDKENSV